MISSQPIFALSAGCLAEKQQIPMCLVRSDWGSNPRSTALEESTLSITPLMWFTRKVQWPTSCSTKLQYSHRGYITKYELNFFKWNCSTHSYFQKCMVVRYFSKNVMTFYVIKRAMKRFALFDLLKSLYSDTKILSKYIPSLQKR